MEITQEQYEEYSNLKRMLENQVKLDAAKSVRRLEDDIDTPVRKCVAAFALLGCEPKWSCCGFDYDGQPLYKHHQYGRVYFILGNNDHTTGVIRLFPKFSEGVWIARAISQDEIDFHLEFFNPIPQWCSNDCIHYHEPAAVGIGQLELYLAKFQDIFSETATVKDSNGRFRHLFPAWQFPAREDWIVTKDSFSLCKNVL